MKIAHKIKGQFTGLGDSFLRFPVTAILSFSLMVILIIQNEQNIDGIYETEQLRRLAMTSAVGMLLSISLKQLQERFWPEKSALLVTIPPTALAMAGYYLFFTKELDMVNGLRFAGTLVALIIAIFYSLRLKNHADYEPYVVRVFNGFFITVLYSGVLYFGISAIIFTINALFDAEIEGKWYLYFFLFVTFVFGALMFLSKLPKPSEDFLSREYSRPLKVLLLYIVIPLITIYTGILYVYFIQILLTQEWPRGLVSNLVLWYSVVSAAVIFFITPILEENQVARLFRTWFPRILLPILAMMFVSIGKRIQQYGVTENRYLIVLLGIWVLVIMLYFVTRKHLTNIFIPVSLSIVALIAVYGPLSAFNVSSFSQNQRFTALLEKNSMLSSGQVVPGTDVSEEDRRNISSIVSFFESRDLDAIRYLDADFEYNEFQSVFGFSRESEYPYENQEYVYLSSNMEANGMDISGFDYLFTMSNYMDAVTYEGITAQQKDITTLVLKRDDVVIMEENLLPQLMEIIDKHQGQMEKGQLAPEEAVILLENDEAQVKVLIRELAARKASDKGLQFDNLSLTVLVKDNTR